ncbi:MAG: acyl-CoA dehydrogenase [Phenylobacterium sp.]|nr:acyl-CoA dehydrogenase [Phenylobacterium sp.]
MLADAARSWVRERAPVSALRKLRSQHAELGYDPDLYAEMVAMGWTGMIVPEAYSGHEFGFQGMGLLAEALGRNLAPSPLIASAVTAASALLLGGTQAQKAQWLPRLVDGSSIGTLALEEAARHQPAGVALTASRSGDGWRLDGWKRPVEFGMAADLFVVAARTSGRPGEAAGVSLFLCEASSEGVERHPLTQIDARGDAAVRFQSVALSRAQLLGAVDEGLGLLDQVLDRTRAVLAAEMLGSLQEAFERTVDYLKIRKQFGRHIGSFQALQHRAADLLGEIELVRSAVYAALAALDSGSEDVALLVSSAKALAGRTFGHVAREMIQMHGGIGMTDEHDAGLYLKRAHAADISAGNVAFHRERFGKLLGV